MPTEILNHITQHYYEATSGWYSHLFPIAHRLFAMLAIIEIAWSGIMWTLQRDVNGLCTDFLKKILAIGFAYALLLNAHQWIPDIIKSFMKAGATAAHVQHLHPSDILDQGITIASIMFDALFHLGVISHPLAAIVGIFSAFIIVLCFAIIAAQLIITLIEAYIVIGAGTLLLGFGASRWSAKFTTNYLSYAFSVGVKLFVLYLILGVGASISSQWQSLLTLQLADGFAPIFEIIAGSLVFVFLTWSIPAKAESLLNGSVNATLAGFASTTSGTLSATQLPARSAMGAAGSTNLAIKQAGVIAQGASGKPGMRKMRGAMQAGMNLASAAVGSASGYYSNTRQGMAEKTKSIREKQYTKQESDISSGKTARRQ